MVNRFQLPIVYLMLASCTLPGPTTEAEQKEIDNQLNTRLVGADSVDNPYGSLSDFLKSNDSEIGDGSFGTGNVNLWLWQSSVNILANYGILSADPATGLIITTWSQAEGTNDEFQLVVQVIGRELRSGNIQVTGSLKTTDKRNSTTRPLSSTVTSSIKDAILLRARELRVNQ